MSNAPTRSKFGIAAAQLSSVKGDIPENVTRHIQFANLAAKHGAGVVVFPELSLTGYEPTIAADTAIDSRDSQLQPLQRFSDEFEVAMIVGCPIRSDEAKPYIGAFVIRPRLPIETYRKRFLDGDEVLSFIPSNDVVVCDCHSRAIGVAICADINHPIHAADASQEGASVYAAGVAITPRGITEAEANMSQYARKHNFLAVMANYATETGGYSIAGRSAIWNESGKVIARAPESGECLVMAMSTSEGWLGTIENRRED